MINQDYQDNILDRLFPLDEEAESLLREFDEKFFLNHNRRLASLPTAEQTSSTLRSFGTNT